MKKKMPQPLRNADARFRGYAVDNNFKEARPCDSLDIRNQVNTPLAGRQDRYIQTDGRTGAAALIALQPNQTLPDDFLQKLPKKERDSFVAIKQDTDTSIISTKLDIFVASLHPNTAKAAGVKVDPRISEAIKPLDLSKFPALKQGSKGIVKPPFKEHRR